MTAPSKALSPSRFLTLAVAMVLALIAGVCLLPHDRHLRFASLQQQAVVKAGWIYERIHDDPTPIDVMFIGTSHTVFGVDSGAVERATRELAGHDVHVVNFGLQHLGRNVHWLLAREAIETRRVRMLVLEAQEDEPRALHPAFASLAEASDLLGAPLLVNTSYLADLSQLPLRQVSLFLRSMGPAMFGAAPDFDLVGYRGAHWDDTWAEEGSAQAPIRPLRPRNTSPSAAKMQLQRTHATALIAGKLSLPPSLAWLERRANLYYIAQIAALAQRHDVALRFLYLPSYQAAARPVQAAAYRSFGPIWYPPPELLADRLLWLDVNHLNYDGARALAKWLAAQLWDGRDAWEVGAELPDRASANDRGECGYPADLETSSSMAHRSLGTAATDHGDTR